MADLFEEYKEALKKGHVAVLRGEFEAAIEHYRAASLIAPDRALPHSSLGGVLLRLGRIDEAVAAYDEAVQRGPSDETALTGRSDALLAAGRRPEAAEVLDRLAMVQAERGRQPEALATRDLARGIRAAEAMPQPDSDAGTQHDQGSDDAAVAARVQVDAADDDDSAQTPEAEPEPEPTPALLVGEAERAVDEGRRDQAVRAYVLAAAGYASGSTVDAGLDACQVALTIAPGSPDVHLALARLYFERGWHERAVDKLVLLDRLLELDGANGWGETLATIVAEHAADDPRLADLSARRAVSSGTPSGD